MQIPVINKLFKNVKKEEYTKYLDLVPDFKQEKTQKFITIALTLATSIILGFFAVSPTLSTIANLQKQIEDNKFVEEKLHQKINNLSVLQQKYAETEADLPIIYDAIPQIPQIPLLLGQIQSITSDSNIKLNNFQTFQVDVSQGAVAGKKFSSFDFSLTAQGNYQDMLSFMNKLVSFQRIITVTNISIGKATGFNTTALQINIKGTAYFKE